jgi:hypothetical protein
MSRHVGAVVHGAREVAARPWPPCHGPPAYDAAYGQAVNGCPPRVVDNVGGPSHGRASEGLLYTKGQHALALKELTLQ